MVKKKRKTIWRIWAKALGEKGSKCDREADIIAIVRTFIFMTYLVTNVFIISGVIYNITKPTCCTIDAKND